MECSAFEHLPCEDFLQFSVSSDFISLFEQNLLKQWREDHDKIRYELNAALPTTSFNKSINQKSICNDYIEKVWLFLIYLKGFVDE